jgi:aldehyde dehydrogenase
MNKPEFLTTTKSPFAERYDNFIGGKWVAPRSGKYFDNASPVTGQVICKIARSDAQDIDAALDAAHAAKDPWGRTSVAERAIILNRIADRMEANLERLAIAETRDNGKPIRETRAADLPLAIDHFRYFAGAIRSQEGPRRNRSRHRGLSLPRTARRGRPDHPVELPPADGMLETGTGARCR